MPVCIVALDIRVPKCGRAPDATGPLPSAIHWFFWAHDEMEGCTVGGFSRFA